MASEKWANSAPPGKTISFPDFLAPAPPAIPPSAKPGIFNPPAIRALISSGFSSTTSAGITASPLDSQDSIESEVPFPGPFKIPPFAILGALDAAAAPGFIMPGLSVANLLPAATAAS